MTTKIIAHYMLFGPAREHATRSMLLGARQYIARFTPTIGFSAADAANAQTVTIVGDARAVPADVDAQLQQAGCNVERLNGDQYMVDALLAERVRRGAA